MQIDLLEFIGDRNDKFSVYSKAIIDNGAIIVRPCVDVELKNLKQKLNYELKALVLVIQTSQLKNLGYITISRTSDTDLLFEQVDCDQEKDIIVEVNTNIVDFFRKNMLIENIYVSNDFILQSNFYSVGGEHGLYKLATPVWNEENELILTAGPSVTPLEVCYASDAARNGWNTEWKKYLTAFETEFAKYVGAKYAISTSSCTGALQIALHALGIGSGDEVLVPDLTWVASATAIRDVGASPIFVDVELDSWNMDPLKLESKLTSNTKAIVVVHMYGGPARIRQIVEFAEKHGLCVVEDAAPAIGAEYEGKRVGTFGQFGCYSFQGAKLLVTGEGGMIVTDDDDLYVKALKIADQGRNPSKVFWIDEHGVKFKMSNIQAALGLAQIQRADTNIQMKRRIFQWYNARLGESKFIAMNHEIKNAKSIYWMSSIRLLDDCPVTRDELIQILKLKNIDSRPVFPAISQYPIWDSNQQAQPNAKYIGQTSLNLPSGVALSKAQVDYVCDVILEAASVI